MANRSYLAATDNDTIYPSAAESDYDPDAQTIAQGVYCVPLLWLGLFRPSDMRIQDFNINGDTVTGVAPVSDVERAVAQLRQSAAKYDQMFPGGHFADYCNLLADAVTSIGRKYVTIEMEEIACMADPDQFYDDCRLALRSLAGDEPIADGRDKLIAISEINSKANIPFARCLLDDVDVSDDEMDTHSRIIGCAWIRAVPWENDA
jgi:hypothetical protein